MERTCSICGETKDEKVFQPSFNGARKNYCFACKGRREVARSRLEMYENLGDHCACCGESHPKFLTFDHVQNDGAAHRKKLAGNRKSGVSTWLEVIREARRNGWPKDKYQVLCYNCNCAKGHWGECPHKTRETVEAYIASLRDVVSLVGKKHRNYQEKINNPDFVEKRQYKSEEMVGNKRAAKKLSAEMVKEIRRLAGTGMLQREVAEKFGVGRQMVSLIINRKRWA